MSALGRHCFLVYMSHIQAPILFTKLVAKLQARDFADTTADRIAIVRGILVPRGILAGGAHVAVVGERFDEYPVLGARFISDTLPELYAYAVPALRFTLRLVWSIGVVGRWLLDSPKVR